VHQIGLIYKFLTVFTKAATGDSWSHFRHGVCHPMCEYAYLLMAFVYVMWKCASFWMALLITKLKQVSDIGLTIWRLTLICIMH